MSDGLAMVLLAKAAALHRHGFTVSRWLGFGFYFDLLNSLLDIGPMGWTDVLAMRLIQSLEDSNLL